MKIKLRIKTVFTCLLLLLMQGAWAQPFNQKLPIPPLYKNAMDTFTIVVSQGTHNFYSSQTTPTNTGTDTLNFNVSIPTMGYNGMGYLGPTMVWHNAGQPVTVNQINNMPMRTTIHWHGLNLPAHLDGGPQEPIEKNGGVFNTNFRVIDQPQPAWYHSHLMDSTTYQVIKGLAGMVYIENPSDLVHGLLPHHYDTNDFPIILQDKGFIFGPRTPGPGGAAQLIALDTAATPGSPVPPSIHNPGNGNYTLVNGVINGYLKVPKGLVRLRFLNGAYRKTFQIAVGNKVSSPTTYMPMDLIATDGGYTAIPHTMDSLIIGPGERYEVLVDFSLKNNKDTLYLNNRSGSLPNGGGGGVGYVTGGFTGAYGKNAFMCFIVDTSLHPATPGTKPATLLPYSIDTSNVFKYRTKVLGNADVTGGNQGSWTINGDTMDMMKINDTLLVNKKEIWTIKNTTNVYHPFHIHKVQFQVIDIRDTSGNVLQSFYNSNLPKNWMGYKDDALIPPYKMVRFIASFDSFPSADIDPMYAFMYHCHILTHEDNSMMQQWVVVDSMMYYYGIHTGMQKPSSFGSFVMYPNPASSTLNIKGESKEPGTIRIVDVVGRNLHEQAVTPFNGSIAIPVGDLPRGLVFVEWTSGSNRYVQRIYLK